MEIVIARGDMAASNALFSNMLRDHPDALRE
jgi:hypothetical protein